MSKSIQSVFYCLFLFAVLIGCKTKEQKTEALSERLVLADTIEHLLRTNLVDIWYPACIDTGFGGYLTSFDKDFRPGPNQQKMIVSQGRLLWNASKAAMHWPADKQFMSYAKHGFEFLRDKMWDKHYGGFYQLVDQAGHPLGDTSKTAYGNSFGLYATATYYMMSKDPEGLDLAKKTFNWLEEHSHDPALKGYYQHLTKTGAVIQRPATTPSTSDLGYKDQNSSIHLLEAMTALYEVWPDPLVKSRLEELIYLVRDTIVNEKGNLLLFFKPDWTPISFRDSSHEVIEHQHLDYVSWGHDIETAYLLMEASQVAGWKNDTTTWRIAKKMADQCFAGGWDDTVGGFFDDGYYFKDVPGITVTQATKNWWTQAEGLNTLLILSDLYPNDPLQYADKFKKQWSYINTYLIDHKRGEWYSSGLDKSPENVDRGKGNIWKAAYHHYRSLENCVKRLRDTEKPHQ